MKRSCCLALLVSALACAPSPAATFVVTNLLAIGPGSISNAIVQANTAAGLDTIAFDIAGPGLHTISITNPLPPITNSVVIDGYTQPGSSPNTLAEGHNAVLLIELSGGGRNFSGLVFIGGGTNCAVRGLVMNGFGFAGAVGAIQIGPFAGRLNSLNVVEGCFLGTDPTGRIALGNRTGVSVLECSGNRVGGPTPAARNLISGNEFGVGIGGSTSTSGGSNNVVLGNFIGTDATGTNALPNTRQCISLGQSATNSVIGGTNVAARNIIAGNGDEIGIHCNDSLGTVIQGNFIGTDVTGTKSLGLEQPLRLSSFCQVGGLTSTAGAPPGNVIVAAAAGFQGIVVSGASNVVIQGNLVGTDATGTTDLSSGGPGISLSGANLCTIGGTNAGAGNLISGHNGDGIVVVNGGNRHVIQGNRIGTDITGVNPLGNSGNGIAISTPGSGHIIGGMTAGAGNIIAFNGQDGVNGGGNNASTNNLFSANAIFANGHLGIDLESNGVSGNDVGDGDPGANQLQNFPVLTGVTVDGGNVTLSGALNSGTNAPYRLEFFANASCDASGHGEGQVFLGATDVVTDGSGNAAFAVTLPNAGFSTFTATAIDANGNTSEFSACASVSGPCIITCPPNLLVSTAPGQCGATVSFFPTTSGNCGAVTCSPASGSFFAKGTTPVTCSTAAGANCSFTVTVNDTQPPAITCSSNIVITVLPSQINAVVNYSAPVVVENCPGVTTNCSPASGSLFPLGSTMVTCTATDASGNSTTCSFTVTVRTTSSTFTWDGGGADDSWTNALNWVEDTLPTNGDGLVFPATAARRVNTNSVDGPTTLAFIEWSGSDYVLFSPPLTLFNGLTNAPPFLGSNRLHAAITLAGNQTWLLGPPGQKTTLTLASNVALSSFTLTVDAATPLRVEGNVTGSADSQLLKEGNSQLILNGAANHLPDLRVRAGLLVVDGVLSGGLSISNGATLSGNGTVPPFVCAGSVEPGGPASPGPLTVFSGAASFHSGSELRMDLFGSIAPGVDHDQLQVSTPPDLSGARLRVIPYYSAQVGETFVIIANSGAAPFATTFAGLPEGSIVVHPQSANTFRVSYVGGDGNDVVLTRVPASEDTVPRLTIEPASTNAVRLLWPTNPPGFNLECNTNLLTTNWLGASPLPTVTGTNNVVTNATTEAQKFYRLKRN